MDMNKWNIACGFYQKAETAQTVLKSLRKAGLYRTAFLHRDHEGNLSVKSNNLTNSIVLFSVLFFFLTSFLMLILSSLQYPIIIVFSLITLSAWLYNWLFLTVDPNIIAKGKRWVITGEILIIVQVKSKNVTKALNILREVSSGHPISFLFRPRKKNNEGGEEQLAFKEPLTTEQLSMEATKLAASLQHAKVYKTGDQPLLRSLLRSKVALEHIRQDIAEAEVVEQTITSSAEWLLDNNYVIQGNIEEARRNLPKKYYNELPKLTEGKMKGFPRIYMIAREIVYNTVNVLNKENLITYLKSYQSVEPLTMGELWALPLMLRIRLIENLHCLALDIDRRIQEGEYASFWGNRILTVSKREPKRLQSFLHELQVEFSEPSSHIAEELLDHFYGEETIIPIVRTWLESKFQTNINDVLHAEQKLISSEQISFSNAIVSLITLSKISWREIFEFTNPVDEILSKDPCGIYSNMDFKTRDGYRHAIEMIARRCCKTESQIALKVIELANQANDEVERHVGYYLIDRGRLSLQEEVHFKPTLIQNIRRTFFIHPYIAYLGAISAITFFIELSIFLILSSWDVHVGKIVILGFFALLPSSEIALQLVNLFFTQFLPPNILPKMSFKQGIPVELKTLVVVPTMFTSVDSINENIHRLEIHFLANQEAALRFGLFFDFMDFNESRSPDDQKLLETAEIGIKKLEEKYGNGKFFLLYRERTWSNTENRWIGYERKRGKLELLNRFLTGNPSKELIIKVGNADFLHGIRYVITLDEDTQLPKETARVLVETISHPLNSPRLSSEGNIERGFTIIQPRVSTNFSLAKLSLFSEIFSDAASLDPYTQAISDIYQDLMHAGTYHGKGIYDVQTFHRILDKRFPEEHLLSHDLIEGNFVKVGFASDISLLDLFPPDYATWTQRHQRWMRGDWQIIDWLFSKAPNGFGKEVANSLDILDRWKIFDNLRRALLPVSLLILLVASWFMATWPLFWGGFVTIALFLPTVSLFFLNTISHPRYFTLSWKSFITGLLRTLINIILLPHQAYLSLDALFRVIYRRFVSHKHFLQWSGKTSIKTQSHKTNFSLQLLPIAIFSILLLWLVLFFSHKALMIAVPFCLLWFISPLVVCLLDKSYIKKAIEYLSLQDQYFIRRIARKTWRYFDDFIGPQTNWLPPDNYQSALLVEVAQRTSPTNMGLGLLAVLSAYDLKYNTSDEVIDRIMETLSTFSKLEMYEGHYLNWYDIQSLKPLYPRYVSTVDSGNFLASLWTLEQGIKEIHTDPLLSFNILNGLEDTFNLLCAEIKDPEMLQTLLPLKSLDSRTPTHVKPPDLSSLIKFIRSSSQFFQNLNCEESDNSNVNYWLKKITQQFQAWENLSNRYFSWIDVFNEIPFSHLEAFDVNAIEWKNEIFHAHVSLYTLTSGELEKKLNPVLQSIENVGKIHPEISSWHKKFREALNNAAWLAGEKLAQSNETIIELQKISHAMNMRFLFNNDRKLFSIGYHVDDRKLDGSFYDLLASEARIASLVAIAKGDVPVSHWWTLGRSYGYIYGRHVLMSWGGTMFEYLMPLLFNFYYPDSLLGQACKSAVDVQIIYGKKRGIPWGISEAAFSEIDSRKVYQYRSFGVPGLGFKRDLEEDLVVSPYSSALALAINPSAAIKNLKRLYSGNTNLLSNYGYYESIDFARQHGPHGERGVIVYAFMAHHEGMSLLAFDNILNQNLMPKRFHADPRIAGVENLLYERIPFNPPIAKETRQSVPLSRLAPFSSIPIMGVVDTPHSPTPKINLLSNGDYSVMLTNSGGGYSTWKEVDISRWRSDTTSDPWGNFCYIKDIRSGDVWSSTYHPTYTKGKEYSVRFKPEKVEFRRRDHEIEILSEIVVTPEDNAEIKLLTLANLSSNQRSIELTSYIELALAPHATDRAHPAFNKMFIETEALTDVLGLLAHRRLRDPTEVPLWALHIMATNEPSQGLMQFETDRAKFIGRGRSTFNPIALEKDLSNSQGTVLDPIFSIRHRVILSAGQRIQISFVTAVADSREKALSLMQKYREISSSHRAIEMAWTYSQLELRHLRIHQEEAQLFQKLAGRILYPHGQLRPSTDCLGRNTFGQSKLWSFGISGDLPIVVASIADVHDIDLIKQALVAQQFWRLRGLKTDLVIINDEATGYEHPLFEQLQRIVRSQPHALEIGKPGGVYLLNSDQINEEDHTLLLSVARAHLIAARGSFRQQLITPNEHFTFPHRLIPDPKIKDEPSLELPFIELKMFNEFGGYSSDGREYVIYLGPNINTPAPWINVVANPDFGMLISETGLGTTWFKNSQTNRLTPWSNDPVVNPISDCLYIRDDELGVYWNPTPAPIRELDAYRVSHGQGYSRFEHNSHGIEQHLQIFTPIDDTGGLPVRIQRLRLINRSSRKRILSVFSYSELVLGTTKEETQMHIITDWDPESQALLAFNRYNPDFGCHITFVTSTPLPTSFTGNRSEFLGRNNPSTTPASLKRKRLSGTTGVALDPCAALQVCVELTPGEEKEIDFFMGYSKDSQTARNLIFECRGNGWVNKAMEKTGLYWDSILGKVQIETPETKVNFSLNRWLLYQNLSCRFWGRTAFYQSSGAYGFRDQLQDSMGIVYAAPNITRDYIIKAAAHQFVEGDVQHWWHEPSNGGVRTRISDDLLWLPFVTSHYIKITKDFSILNEMIPFMKGDLLKEDQHEMYFIPEITEEKASLLEHCRRSISKGLTKGPHGLPLIGSGDWNDGMNCVGIGGKGESVWLAWFAINVMNDFAEVLTNIGQESAAEGFKTQAKRLADIVESSSWDGNWYLRAFFDDGTPLGSHINDEDKIDSIAQSWAVISNAGNKERTDQALKSVEEMLIIPVPGVVQLLTPPFNKTLLNPGYIKGYPPGVRENGGQYTHGSLWIPLAFARKGEVDKAVHILNLMHPSHHTSTKKDTERYKVEPYVLAGDVYSLEGQVGRGGWSWYTGSTSWMYRIWLEEICGFHLRGENLILNPLLPKSWNSIKINYKYKTSQYNIIIEKEKNSTEEKQILEIDNKIIQGNEIPLQDDSQTHYVRVIFK
jgi:cyclic beta-1,2-glucan synthetase